MVSIVEKVTSERVPEEEEDALDEVAEKLDEENRDSPAGPSTQKLVLTLADADNENHGP